jgi:polar amino acid transport system substrate-binding protein
VAAIAARTGSSAANVARLARADYCSSDYREILEDASIDVVVIATRHDLHRPIALAAARAGKPFHVEKPLAVAAGEAREIVEAVAEAGVPAAVGFNRRSAPFTRRLRGWLEPRVGPLHVLVRVNAGVLPPDHWTLDPREGGGRLVGEGCHFVDLASYLVGRSGRVTAARSVASGHETDPESSVALTLSFEDGSVASVIYLSNGHRGLPKERIEVSWEGRSVVLDDFRELHAYGVGKSERARVQDKGFQDHFENFLAAVRGEAELVAPVTAGLDAALRIEEAQALLAGVRAS